MLSTLDAAAKAFKVVDTFLFDAAKGSTGIKRLFAIKDTRTGKLLPESFHENKSVAKKKRDQLNYLAIEEGDQPGRYQISYGPDHNEILRLEPKPTGAPSIKGQ